MFAEKPDISETLEWMLQSRQVGDEELVKTLVHQHYSELHQLGKYLFKDSRGVHASRLADQVICAGVEDASTYRQEVRAQVWLFKKAINIYQEADRRGRFTTDDASTKLGEGFAVRYFWRYFDGLPEVARLVCMLKYSHGFSDQEIASIMELSNSEVEARLRLVENKWPEWLRVDTTLAAETTLRSLFSERWPFKVLTVQEEKVIALRILNHLNAQGRHKHRLAILGELILVVTAIAIIAGFGMLITNLTPEPTLQIIYQTESVNQIVMISPTPEPTLSPTPFPDLAILYRAEGGESLSNIAERIFLNETILEALNKIPADQPLEEGQKIMIGISDSQQLMPTPEGGFPIQFTPLLISEPLTLMSSQEVIRQRIMESKTNWHTLWADAIVIQYGIPGNASESEVRRQQIWIDQPYFSYLLDGMNNGEVEYIYTSIGGLVNLINLISGEEETTREPESVQFFSELQEMLMPSEFRDDFIGELVLIGQESIAGRAVLVLDWFTYPNSMKESVGNEVASRIHQGRYWVDTSIGSILRLQKFNDSEQTQLFEEIIVTKIEFNVPIPHRLFDRSQLLQTYFAHDAQGNHTFQAAPVPTVVWSSQTGRELDYHQFPPSDFAANEGLLRFQWTSLATFDPQLGTRVDLFGDGYYLGNIEFSEPNQLICTRSSNGNLIAFTTWSDELFFNHSPLRWFDLTDLPRVNHPLPEIVPYDFAFSPDNQQLAVYGCEREGEYDCGIYLIETASGAARRLTKVEMGSGLIWNPDSSALAIQGSFLKGGKWRLLIFNAHTGHVIYDGPFDWEGFSVAQESPIHDWGVSYPPIRGGLEQCSPPPKGG
jgi:DNA-directed RNA polymerase specialized sigma24 family protein